MTPLHNAPDVIRPSFTRQDGRGILTELLNSGQWQSLLYGDMQTGAVIGNHYHEKTDVFFFILSGSAFVFRIDPASGLPSPHQQLRAHEGTFLKAGVAHAIRFSTDSAFVMAKSLRYDPNHPDTVTYHVLDVPSWQVVKTS